MNIREIVLQDFFELERTWQAQLQAALQIDLNGDGWIAVDGAEYLAMLEKDLAELIAKEKEIEQQEEQAIKEDLVGWHILTVAEDGSSSLTNFCYWHGVHRRIMAKFVGKVTRLDRPCTFSPAYPITAIPRRFFREQGDHDDPGVMEDFRDQIKQFIEINRDRIGATHVCVEFYVSSEPVRERYIAETKRIFRAAADEESAAEEVVQEIKRLAASIPGKVKIDPAPGNRQARIEELVISI